MKKDATARAIHRLRILKGLINKLEDSIESGTYCVEALNQSLAIQRALKSLDGLLLEIHLNSCIKGQMKSGKKSAQLRRELLELYKLSRKEN